LRFWQSISAVAIVAVFISLLVIYRGYHRGAISTETPSDNSIGGIFEVHVVELDSNRGRPGQYFIFETQKLDVLYGANGWEGAEFLTLSKSTAQLQNIVVWRLNPRDVSTMGFGKKKEKSQAGDWKIGDKIIVLTRATKR